MKKKMQYSTLTATEGLQLQNKVDAVICGFVDSELTLSSPLAIMSEVSNKQMPKSTNKLLKRIRECEAQIDNLKTLPYYSIFKQEGQRQKDIAAVEKKLMRLYGDLVIRKEIADKV